MKAFVAVVASLAASANADAGLVLNGALPAGGYIAGAPLAAGAYYAGAPALAGGYLAAAAPALAAAPLAAPAPLLGNTASVVAAPAAPHAQQFHTQDEFGNLAFGYSNGNSAAHEVGNTYGGRTGFYESPLGRVEYEAGPAGFIVTGATNLPVAPAVPAYALPVAPVDTGVAPLPVAETEEVAAARAEHLAAHAEIAAREKRSVIGLGLAPYGLAAPAIAYGAAPAAPAAGLPAARQTIQLTPGHAIFTRVYNLPGEPELINQQ